ncbi:cellobiose phosphorylase [Paenibacillus spiritus]|uniref:Cellobiose phosphorylase n=1 Tax=Paenibacillus spiritus TaxID=2496557 RepID=A0A5J5FZM5_9BACL|nr:cellobiose phosphorylase [Paenibacillus spiritus]KAA8999761.1 cellobiose phosphorylase [Paenibacillus spiritus]
MTQQTRKWEFIGADGDFRIASPHLTSYLYFPLANEAGLMSSVTPTLHGDIKTGHNAFLNEPVWAENLHNSRASRNFWIYTEEAGAWSCAGNSAAQHSRRYEAGGEEDAEVEAGFLWHKLTRRHPALPLTVETISFVPAGDDTAELMKVTLTNTGDRPLTLTPTAAIPLYARSADDLRDHRQVTSLLHRIYTLPAGVEVQPTLSFDERGHRVNRMSYSVLGREGDGAAPEGFFPLSDGFIGEGGTHDWPEAVVRNLPPADTAGAEREGGEAVGAIRFREVTLAPGEARSYVLAMAITDGRTDAGRIEAEYLSAERFDAWLAKTSAFWQAKIGTVSFRSADSEFDTWMKWVTLQPVLRRLFGNSFMPHHDYGRGGRGWRDLWQDCLALMIMEPEEVRSLLFNNFAGVRIDGSNATIIGAKPGEFVADRNNIPRVWMDHGAWPFLTTQLYIDRSGDLDFLLEEQTYFRDAFTDRCKRRDETWTPESGTLLKTASGEVYRGSILEHILLQQLTPFYLVGEHNHMRLEGADWNDGLDMAADRGESVAFMAFYAGNLREIGRLLRELKERTGRATAEIAEEMLLLLDTLGGEPVDYNSVEAKHERARMFFEAVPGRVQGGKAAVDLIALAEDLERKAGWTARHIREREWIASKDGSRWFNGYYNNDGERVEGDCGEGVRMTLTGQVFPVMSGVAAEEQVREVIRAVDRHLLDDRIGYRLNTPFGGIQPNLGRAFGFAFGHKENGAMFSHMTVMYGNALYKRGYAAEGRKVLDSIYRLCLDFERSRIYPGIPEYISEEGRGMYHYLTGSASWLLLTLLMEVYGVRGRFGDLLLAPKLAGDQFDAEGRAAVTTLFAGRTLEIRYVNAGRKDAWNCAVAGCTLNGAAVEAKAVNAPDAAGGVVLPREWIEALPAGGVHRLEITLE